MLVDPTIYPKGSAAEPPEEFDPLSLGDCVLWLDAMDASTIFDAPSGGNPITLDGQVGRWEDKSGNGIVLSEPITAGSPVYKAVGALRVLEGNGHRLRTMSFNLPEGNAPRSVFVVSKGTRDSALCTAFRYGTNGNGNLFTVNNSPLETSAGFGGHRWGSPTGSFERHVTSVIIPVGSTHTNHAEIREDGNLKSSSTRAGAIQTLNTGGTSPFCEVMEFDSFEGDFSEILVYNKELSTADREAVLSFLINKWDIVDD